MTANRTLVDDCRQLVDKGMGKEEILKVLRAQGCSKVKSIAIIAELLEVDLAEAKRIVHKSQTWADVRERDDRFHASLERNLKPRDA